ncbi:MAG: multiheme c-type cytochrome [Saprospiraceae bacterium]|nr:multiheme c-type cytochrome [Saprospiraceae bacterium]
MDKDRTMDGIQSYTTTDPQFVGSETCKTCHEKQYSDWKDSHHDQAMKVADSTSILGDFNNVLFTSNGVKSTFFRKDNEYYVNTEGADGQYHDYQIAYTFGVVPLQQYIVRFPKGQLQCLQTAWDSEQNTWFDLQPDLEIQHDEWLHWTAGGMRWNAMCADCHSTNVHKNYDLSSGAYETTYSEINVGCEACHGPGNLHIEFYQNPNSNSSSPKMYMDTSTSSVDLVDKCARCHSRRSQITKYFNYQGHFLDHYRPSLLIDPIYEIDGQIRDEDYVYSSFIQSKMYHNGVSCKDCHDVHSLKLKQSGNVLCLTCHDSRYDKPSHHFHDLDSEGSECINCHMPGKVYMGNDFRRDHSFRVPRPDQTVKYGTPNACSGCHEDKSPEWARDFIRSKYGPERPSHFSDHLMAAYHGDNASLYDLLNNGDYPEIARATALSQYSNQPLISEELVSITKFLQDTSDLVRNEAVLAFDKSGNADFSSRIEPLLHDSIRLIRISAARYFNTISKDPEAKLDLEMAENEYLVELEMNADFAFGQHQIALYQQAKGNDELAQRAYEKALEIDNYYNTTRMNLALLLYGQGDVHGTEALYLKVIEQEPDFSHSYYMLGLLYHETGDHERALEYLAGACEREPVNLRAFYNYALKLQEVGRNKESISVMDRALQLDPDSESFLYLKLIGQFNDKQFSASYSTCLKLLEIAPNNANYKQILESLTPRI